MPTAYLVVIFDTKPSPPTVLGCDIWSQNDEMLGRDRSQATLIAVDGKSFEEAKSSLLDRIEKGLLFEWVKPLLPADVRGVNHG